MVIGNHSILRGRAANQPLNSNLGRKVAKKQNAAVRILLGRKQPQATGLILLMTDGIFYNVKRMQLDAADAKRGKDFRAFNHILRGIVRKVQN